MCEAVLIEQTTFSAAQHIHLYLIYYRNLPVIENPLVCDAGASQWFHKIPPNLKSVASYRIAGAGACHLHELW